MTRAKYDAESLRARACERAQVHIERAEVAASVLRPGNVDWDNAPISKADVQALIPLATVVSVGTMLRPWAQYRPGTIVASAFYAERELIPEQDIVIFIKHCGKVPRAGGGA